MKKVLLSLVIGCMVLGVGCGEDTVSKDKHDELLKKYEDTVCQLEQFKTDNGILECENEKLRNRVDKAKDYLELDPKEKELVDAKIVEVNQATEDQLAQEKAQKEAEEKAKKEAEEEAKRQAEEEERLRKEEEERQKAEEEAKKQEEQRKATEYANVVKTARNYLNFMAFSRKGLIDQLVYEGYSTESAEYAVDNIGADWNQQCAKKAKDYLEFMSFSREGLYEQLAYEGFTDEQIQYGLSQVGY